MTALTELGLLKGAPLEFKRLQTFGFWSTKKA